MAMHTIRTTQQPGVQITVDEAEYQQLFAWGLIYNGTAPLTPADFYDSEIADRVTNGTATPAALRAAFVPLAALAATPDVLIAGTITRDGNGAATSAPVVWPDGTTGTYTADTLSTAFPGAVDAYHVTYGSPVTKTYTQPAVTRDATSGAVTTRPAMTVS